MSPHIYIMAIPNRMVYIHVKMQVKVYQDKFYHLNTRLGLLNLEQYFGRINMLCNRISQITDHDNTSRKPLHKYEIK